MPRQRPPESPSQSISPVPGWAGALSADPLFQGLLPADMDHVLRHVQPVRVAAGQAFLQEDSEDAGLFLLLEGEVSVVAEGRTVTLIRAPAALGLLALIDGQPRTATLVGFAPSLLAHLPRPAFEALRHQSLAFSANLTRELATQLRRMYQTESRQLAHFDDFFEAPNAKLVPGPYVAEEVDMLLLVMQGDPQKLRALLPPGLRPIPGLGDKFLLTFNAFEGVHSEHPIARGKTFAYHETCPFLPALGPHLQPVVFTPELYPDNLLAIALGREAYGFPKRFGRTIYGPRTVDLSVGGHMVLRGAWQGEQAVGAGKWANHLATLMTGGVALPQLLEPLLGRVVQLAESSALGRLKPAVPVFVHKQIVDESTEDQRILDVDSLIEIPFHVQRLGSFEVLQEPSVRYVDPQHFLQGTCVGGVRVSLSFRFGRGKCWIDYQQAEAPGSGPLSLLKRWRSRP